MAAMQAIHMSAAALAEKPLVQRLQPCLENPRPNCRCRPSADCCMLAKSTFVDFTERPEAARPYERAPQPEGLPGSRLYRC